MAKLERPEAVACLEEILAEADAVMVARGDLGLELPLGQVPHVQKMVTRRAAAPVLVELTGDVTDAATRIGEMLVARGAIPASSVIVLVSISPDLAREPSNFLKL